MLTLTQPRKAGLVGGEVMPGVDELDVLVAVWNVVVTLIVVTK